MKFIDLIILVILGALLCAGTYIAVVLPIKGSFSTTPTTESDIRHQQLTEQRRRIRKTREQQERFRRQSQQRMRDLRR